MDSINRCSIYALLDNPRRWGAACVGEKMPLRSEIVRPITCGGILANFILIWHGQGGPREAARSGGRKWWQMRTKPLEMGLTGMCPATLRIAMVVLFHERIGEITEPLIVRGRFPYPARTGVILMSGLIAMDTGLRRRRGIHVRRGAISVKHVLSGPQKLRGFEDHLDHVLVAMRLGGEGWQGAQKEDVHLTTDGARDSWRIKFSPPSEGYRCVATESHVQCRRRHNRHSHRRS